MNAGRDPSITAGIMPCVVYRRFSLVVIVVEAFTGFASQITAGNHVAHELWRAEPWAEVGFEILCNIEANIDSNNIGECQWPDRVFIPQHHGVIDILS